MTIDGLDIEQAIKNSREVIEADKTLSDSTRSVFEILLLAVTLMSGRLGKNSRNSSKPPSSDPNRDKKSKPKSGKKAGGQNGHKGKTLEPFESPDEIEVIKIDQRSLPQGKYTCGGIERRQVVDIEIKRVIKEYQVEVLINDEGVRFAAPFPAGITHPVQYGTQVKAHAVYMSQYQLIPYKRIEEYFSDQLGIPISRGSIFNFNMQASNLVKSSGAEEIIQSKLIKTDCLHVDETGINIGGVRHWLHSAGDLNWTFFYPHKKRGKEAMDEMKILPEFGAVLCHDHWKPYYKYDNCLHSLCNAHHIRELEYAWEKDNQKWAKQMQELLITIKDKTNEVGGELSPNQIRYYTKKYRERLRQAELECPPPDTSLRVEGQKGKQKRSKSRNLLERLRDYEQDVLRFMGSSHVPFTNNRGENDIRMTKVQQKISGCFRSMDGAKMFCRIRGYLSSCRKQGVSATHSLTTLFSGELPSIFTRTAE